MNIHPDDYGQLVHLLNNGEGGASSYVETRDNGDIVRDVTVHENFTMDQVIEIVSCFTNVHVEDFRISASGSKKVRILETADGGVRKTRDPIKGDTLEIRRLARMYIEDRNDAARVLGHYLAAGNPDAGDVYAEAEYIIDRIISATVYKVKADLRDGLL